MSSEQRAETMAAYLEREQWRSRPAAAADGPALGPQLRVNLHDFSCKEVLWAIGKMANGKAPGPDDVPAEYWKCLAECPQTLGRLTEFLNLCWKQEQIPQAWRTALVSAIHKKGRTDACSNYRPISLLCVGYKVFAALLHKRLVDAGAEDRLSDSQFGFRSGHGTLDAIFVLRRRVELAWAQRSGRVLLLALDWKQAFDSIDPKAMVVGLSRFGVPEKMIRLIRSIYAGRIFPCPRLWSDLVAASSKFGDIAGLPSLTLLVRDGHDGDFGGC
jgi:hypothetical protein